MSAPVAAEYGDGSRSTEGVLQLVELGLARAELLVRDLGQRHVGGAADVVHVGGALLDEQQAGRDLAALAVVLEQLGRRARGPTDRTPGASLRRRTVLPSCSVTVIVVPSSYVAVISCAGGTKSACTTLSRCLRVCR